MARQDGKCIVCGSSDGTLQLAHKVPFLIGVVDWGITPEWLDRAENLVLAHKGKCNDRCELTDEEILQELETAGACIQDSPVAACGALSVQQNDDCSRLISFHHDAL